MAMAIWQLQSRFELDVDKEANFIGREGTNWEKEIAILEGFGNS